MAPYFPIDRTPRKPLKPLKRAEKLRLAEVGAERISWWATGMDFSKDGMISEPNIPFRRLVAATMLNNPRKIDD